MDQSVRKIKQFDKYPFWGNGNHGFPLCDNQFDQYLFLWSRDLSEIEGREVKGKNKIGDHGHSHNHRYHADEFLIEEIGDAFAAADLVVSRAGLGALTELSVLGKAAIIIPIPDSHQEANANFFAAKGAVMAMEQKNITPKIFLQTIKKLIVDPDRLTELGHQIKTLTKPDAAGQIVAHLRQICYTKEH